METNNQTSEEEMKEIELWEFSLSGEEIDELIEELKKLKENKSEFTFEIDEDHDLVLHYEDGGEKE